MMFRIRSGAAAAGFGGWLRRLALFAVLWWIVAEGRTGGWPIAAAAVVCTTWVSLTLLPDRIRGLSLSRIVRFLPYFLQQAVLGGLGVAGRALRPSAVVDPILIDYPLRIRGDARVLLTNIVSLLPGTVGVELIGDRLRVHVIDAALPAREKLRELESRIASLTGARLS